MLSTTSSPYQSFAKILSSYQAQYSDPGPSTQLDGSLDFDTVLDGQGGLVRTLMKALEDTLKEKASSGNWDASGEDQISEGERESLLLEHRTWQLMRTIYENRLRRFAPDFDPPSAKETLEHNPYIPEDELSQLVVEEDEELSLYAALIDHLQTRPFGTTAPPLEARHGYLPSTLRKAKAAQFTAEGGNISLDPDFTLRDPQGKGLAGEDATYQGPLMETIWDLVRHGDLEGAIRTCQQGGESWRGATLVGGRHWGMGGLVEGTQREPNLEGNRSRALWKKACRAIAKNPLLSTSERAVYAALVSDLACLLPACNSWEDHLWAHTISRIESRVERKLEELGGFWADEGRLIGKDEDQVIVQGGLEEVFMALSQVQDYQVASTKSNPYYVAQEMIIRGKTDLLLRQFAERLPELEENMSPELIGPLTRFFAHLVLVLRNLDQSVPDAAANIIIQAYLEILDREGNDTLVAMYAACLREGTGEESYASFLHSMDPSATKKAREEALNRAKQHNLDTASIARETVRLILEEAFTSIPSLEGEQPDITLFSTGLSDRDIHLVRSIEWLTFTPETRYDALVRSNDVARYFLALGQANAADALLRSLSSSILDVPEDDDVEDNLLEHEQYRILFTVFANHDVVEEIMSRRPKHTATKLEQHNWRKGLGLAIDKTRDLTVELLTMDWLRFHVSSTQSQRKKELRRIRNIFIPDLVMRLHNLLITHSDIFPTYLQTAMNLTKVVANEEYHVYPEFLGKDQQGSWRLEEYLQKIRETSLLILEQSGENPFGLA